ncbi:hypothetical protein WIW90_02435 [Sulfolobaceae archaeon RB850M]
MPGLDEWASDVCLAGGCYGACTICWSLPPGMDVVCYYCCLDLCAESVGCGVIDWAFSLIDP